MQILSQFFLTDLNSLQPLVQNNLAAKSTFAAKLFCPIRLFIDPHIRLDEIYASSKRFE
jgi:hypothetical protein